ncbi:glutamate receptor 2-like isoform X2 [Lineus longissimus]|uniref:glutamate receptor 2-like isoform X2 n=1 Tax=Lineus longissimus TaxID=88925 RepID=UPI002B4E2BFB
MDTYSIKQRKHSNGFRHDKVTMGVALCWLLKAGFCLLLPQVASAAYGTAPKNVTFGVIIPETGGFYSKAMKLAVDLAVQRVANDPTLLPNINLLPLFKMVDSQLDTFQSITAVSEFLHNGVHFIVGPDSSTAVKATQPICQGMHIPQLAPSATDPILSSFHDLYPYLLKMSSPDSLQSTALYDLVIKMRWTRVAILTSSSDYGRNGLTEFQRLASRGDALAITSVDMFHAPYNASLTDATKQLKAIIAKGTRIVILNCLSVHAYHILTQAAQLGMLNKGWGWLVTDGVTSELPISNEPICNVTVQISRGKPLTTAKSSISNSCMETPLHLRGLLGTRPSMGAGDLYPEFVSAWENITKDMSGDQNSCCNDITSLQFMGYAVKTYDSVLVIAHGLDNFLRDGNNLSEYKANPPNLANIFAQARPDGKLLFKYLREVNIPGAMNWLNFTEQNRPFMSDYQIVNLDSKSWRVVGNWSQTSNPPLYLSNSTDIYFPSWTLEKPADFQLDLKNKTLRIVTILEAPFVMENNGSTAFPGRKYQGFCIDLLDALQEKINFKYDIHLVKDGNYGAQDAVTEEWNGIVREILDDEADIAVAPLTISYDRSQVVSFTKPYMDFGLTILMGRTTPEKDVLAFLHPFSLNLWLGFSGFLCLAAVSVWVCATFSPYGYRGRYAQRRDRSDTRWRSQSLAMSLYESVHFAFAAIVSANTDAIPRSLSGRIIGNAWWLCVFFITSSYTANLAAFLTVARLNTGVSSIEDLATQTDIKYGTVASSQPEAFFERRLTSIYGTMYEFMKYQNTNVATAAEGIAEVRKSVTSKGKSKIQAFIFDSTILDYAAQSQPCNVLTIGRVFAKAGYGLAMRKNSPFLHDFNQQVIALRDEGKLESLHTTWFKGGCPAADSASTNSGGDQLNFWSMAGVFFCFLGLFVIGMIVLICEYFIASYRRSKEADPGEIKRPTFSESISDRKKKIRNDLCYNVCGHCWPKLSHVDDDVSPTQSQTAKNDHPGFAGSNGVIPNAYAMYHTGPSPDLGISHQGSATKCPPNDFNGERYTKTSPRHHPYHGSPRMIKSVRV